MRSLFRQLQSGVRAARFYLAVLVCRVLRVRFLVNPVYPPSLTRIGHLGAEPDCFVKEGILGLRRRYIGVILIERDRAANPCLLDYWRQHLRVISSPFWVRLLAPLAEVQALRYHTDPYVTAMNETAAKSAIQAAYAGRPPLLQLTREHREEGEAVLRRLGVPEGAWIVGVHCREGGYDSNDPYHRGRNASIEAYSSAMQAIVERGGWCVRMGDPSMTPLPQMPGVIDYAHSPLRSDRMDVFLCATSRFILGSASGLCILANVFGVRCAIANQALPIIDYPYGPTDVYIPKFFLRFGDYMTIPEILGGPLGNARFTHCMELAQVTAENSSPEDICDLALEVLGELEGTFQETEEDRQLQGVVRSLMRPGNYTYGAISRLGRLFLRKYRWLLQESRGAAQRAYLAPCCGTRECPCLREGPTWAAQQLSLASSPSANKDAA